MEEEEEEGGEEVDVRVGSADTLILILILILPLTMILMCKEKGVASRLCPRMSSRRFGNWGRGWLCDFARDLRGQTVQPGLGLGQRRIGWSLRRGHQQLPNPTC